VTRRGGACGHSHDPPPRLPDRGGRGRKDGLRGRAARAASRAAAGRRRARQAAAGAARIAAGASSQSYPIDDGSGATIAVDVTAACATNCTADDPQQIADFVGTLIHGPEVDLLTVQLDTPFQIIFDCGLGAEACYYSGEAKIVLSGDEETGSDGAGRDFVLAHEYGHHVAQHRTLPAPFGGTVDWGTERWASSENVCQGRREGRLYPGDEGSHYFEDPGEAFAHDRFPQDPVRWCYSAGLRPTAAAFQAIREDTLRPGAGGPASCCRGTYRPGGRARPSRPCARRSTA
jgi:hypothetical protein